MKKEQRLRVLYNVFENLPPYVDFLIPSQYLDNREEVHFSK